jgi:hypothetical protein
MLLYFVSVFLYNIFAIYVTYLLNSVWHAILENFRPGAIWIVDLLLYYAFTHRAFGEAWTKWSWLELVGMFVMIIGTAIYNGSVSGRAPTDESSSGGRPKQSHLDCPFCADGGVDLSTGMRVSE